MSERQAKYYQENKEKINERQAKSRGGVVVTL